MSRKKKHPDEALFAKYEAFHTLFLDFDHQMENMEDYGEWEERSELQTAQWLGMLNHMMEQKPKTPAGLALLALAGLHAFDFRTGTWDGHDAFQKWDGYSINPDLDRDCPIATAFARLAEYAMEMAPEVKERGHAA